MLRRLIGSLASAIRETLDDGRTPASHSGIVVSQERDLFVRVWRRRIRDRDVSADQDRALVQRHLPRFRFESPTPANLVSSRCRRGGEHMVSVGLAPLALLWVTFLARCWLVRVWVCIRRRFSACVRELRAADVLQKLGLAAKSGPADDGRPVDAGPLPLRPHHAAQAAVHPQRSGARRRPVAEHDRRGNARPERKRPAEDGRSRRQSSVGAQEQLAINKRRRTTRRLERLSDLFLPVMIVLLGAFVLFQVLAIFTPLVNLVCGLSA